MSSEVNWAETVTGKLGTYVKAPTPDSRSTSDCNHCALNYGTDAQRCPRRDHYVPGTSMDCVNPLRVNGAMVMRFIWKLGAPDYSRFDEGGVV